MSLYTRSTVYALIHALDPQHQGECWPDPVAWDGRPLSEQARDLIVLAESALSDWDGDSDGFHEHIASALSRIRGDRDGTLPSLGVY